MRCDLCKQYGLHWVETWLGWRLFWSDGRPHLCGPFRRTRAVTAFFQGMYGKGREKIAA